MSRLSSSASLMVPRLVSPYLSIGCFASICRDRLGDQLVAFSEQFPDVGVGIHEMPRTALVQALEADEVALAIIPGALDRPFEGMRLWSDRVVAALPSGHHLAGQVSVAPAMLADELFLASRTQHGCDMHRFLSERILPGVRAATALHDVEYRRLLGLVAQGKGVALLCRSHVTHDHPGVALLPIEGAEARFPVHAYWREGHVDDAVSALVGIFAPDEDG